MSQEEETFDATRSSVEQSKEVCFIEEQKKMFGESIVRMFDTIHDRIETVMEEGVMTLPYLPTTTEKRNQGKEALLQILRESYRTNMDLAELYAIRNIFTIPTHYTKLQRQQILNNYWKELNTPTTTSTSTNITMDEATQQQSIHKNSRVVDLPKNAAEIPPKNDLDILDQEILDIQSKLRKAKERRNKCRMELQTIKEASNKAFTTYNRLEQVVGMTNNNNKIKGFEKVQESINTAILGEEVLKDLCVKGKELSQTMDDIKAEREKSKNEDETMNLENAMKHIAKEAEEVQKRKNDIVLSLDDDLEERKKKIKINITKGNTNENKNDATSFASILKH